MRQIHQDLFVQEQWLRFMGLRMQTRMTVVRLGEDLLIHSPIDVPPESLSHLGKPRWVLSPNKMHHLFAKPWIDAGLEAWAAPGLPEKRSDLPFHGIVNTGDQPFGDGIQCITVTSFPLSNEVVLFHNSSKTLIVTDLLFNFSKDTPLMTRMAMFFALAYPGPRASILEMALMKRSLARQEIAAILDFDFERIMMCHGNIIEKQAKDHFAKAYRWLGIN